MEQKNKDLLVQIAGEIVVLVGGAILTWLKTRKQSGGTSSNAEAKE